MDPRTGSEHVQKLSKTSHGRSKGPTFQLLVRLSQTLQKFTSTLGFKTVFLTAYYIYCILILLLSVISALLSDHSECPFSS